MKVPVLNTGRPSFWRDRDPRVKWLTFLLFLALIYIAPDWRWMAGAVLVGAGVAASARAPMGWLALMLLIHAPTILALVVIPMLGQDFAFNAEFEFGLRLSLGWIAAILIGVGLFSTMEIDELVEGLSGLGLPHGAAFVVGYAFVLIYLSLSDLAQIMDSMRLKGMTLAANRPISFLRNVPRLFIPALLTIMRRGGAMTAALETRGFGKTIASPDRVALDVWDWIVVAAALLANTAALTARLGLW
ncbi:MAG: energy-coupling factor transporter transmembrane component T [Erythrobacter sp.]|uniref:energy-coupling factor transporter transmembrane component T family protein n=1 Tax=Erythrobacter sp. TaxID=1042 RepID=UPI0032EC28B0